MDKVKQYLGFVYAGLVALLAGVVYWLIGRNAALSSKLGQLEADKKLAQVISDKDKAEKEAEESEKEYYASRDKFIARLTNRGDK